MPETPNFFSTYHQMSASSSWTGGFFPSDLLVFGFPAVGVRVNNACSDRLFYALGAQACDSLTTQADFVAGCAALLLDGALIGGISLMTTASSCTARPFVGVSAWASA